MDHCYRTKILFKIKLLYYFEPLCYLDKQSNMINSHVIVVCDVFSGIRARLLTSWESRTVSMKVRSIMNRFKLTSRPFIFNFKLFVFVRPATEDWDMLDVDEDEKLTGEEEFELLAGPLGLSERRIVPEAVQFPDSDPLGASIAMVTATNSMEETLLQIGEEDFRDPITSGDDDIFKALISLFVRSLEL